MDQAAEVGYTTPAGMVFVAITIILMLMVKRKHAWIPMAMAGCWMTLGQNIVIAGINLPVLRLVLAAALLRLFFRGEFKNLRFLPIDWVFALWLVSTFVTYVALWQTTESVINRLGMIYNAVGIYYCLRAWILTREDVDRVIRGFVWILLPVAIIMCVEKVTGRNFFALFGGVPFNTVVRDGKLRCQGPFAHPILGGTVGAVWFPLFAQLLIRQRSRLAGILGCAACVAIVFVSRSSGPLLTLIVTCVGLSMWFLRRYMQVLRWAALVFLIALQLVMKVPIWFLLSRINVVSGSTGWHRANLIDKSVDHFGQWFLLGVKDIQIKQWGVHAADITNHYLFEGLRGGFSTMALFLAILTLVFAYVGRSVKRQIRTPWDAEYYYLAWAIGVMAAAHAATFISVAYFNPQILMHWFITIVLAVAMFRSMPRAQMRQAPALAAGSADGGATMLPEPRPKYVWWGQDRGWQGGPAAARTISFVQQ